MSGRDKVKVKGAKEQPPPPAPANPLRSAWRIARTLLLLLAILYAALLVIGTTKGFRSLLEERLGRELQAKVGIGSSHLTPGLDIAMGKIVLEETGAVMRASASCAKASYRWHAPRPLGSGQPPEFALSEVNVRMAWQGGQWHPKTFADGAMTMAKWMNIPLPGAAAAPPAAKTHDRADDFMPAADSATPTWHGPRLRASVDAGEITWWTDAPEPVAKVAGLRVNVTPLDAPERPMLHFLLQAREISARGQVLAAPFRVESLDTGGQQVLLEMMAGQRPEP